MRKGLVRKENSGAGGEQSHARGERNQWEPRVFWTRKALGPQGALPDTGTWPNARSAVDLEWAASQALTCALGLVMGPLVQNHCFPLAGSRLHQQAESCFQVRSEGRREMPRCWRVSLLGPCRARRPPALTLIS